MAARAGAWRVSGLVAAYEGLLHRAPWRTQAATTGVLWAVGDVCAQKAEGKDRLDRRRALLTGLYGSCIIGPAGHAWYMALDRYARRWFVPGSARFVAGKVAADTFLFGPLHVAAFFTFMTRVEGGNWQDVRAKLRQDYLPTMTAEVIVWPAYQAFNFARVPVRHQLLVCNLATIVDSTFLCWARAQDDWLGLLSKYLGLAKQKDYCGESAS